MRLLRALLLTLMLVSLLSLGLQFGLDVAKGPDDTSIYIQFGSAWVLK
jgi:hypothetical protein